MERDKGWAMYFVQFSTMRVVEHVRAGAFEGRVRKWLTLREAENSYLLGQLPGMVAREAAAGPNGRIAERMFTVEEGEQLMAAGVLFGGGCLCVTWATEEMGELLAELVVGAGCRVASVFAPGHVSWKLAKRIGELKGVGYTLGRAERVYQMTRCTHVLPEGGRLEVAGKGEREMLGGWMERFMEEAEFEGHAGNARGVLDALIGEGALHVWREGGEVVGMAAWTSPTPNGGAINFVYVPEGMRRRGHGKSVVSALARKKLAEGRKFCFILTDVADLAANQLYQSVGARTLCELLWCNVG